MRHFPITVLGRRVTFGPANLSRLTVSRWHGLYMIHRRRCLWPLRRSRAGATYNPYTGTYARGATAYGPYGSASVGQAYNPYTGTYARRFIFYRFTPYGQWGRQRSAMETGARSSSGANGSWRHTAYGPAALRSLRSSGSRVFRSNGHLKCPTGKTTGLMAYER